MSVFAVIFDVSLFSVALFGVETSRFEIPMLETVPMEFGFDHSGGRHFPLFSSVVIADVMRRLEAI